MIIDTVGFIGLGNVGEKLAKNLINSKKKLYIYDKNTKTYQKFKNSNIIICKNLEELA